MAVIPDYKDMYFKLMAKVTDVVEVLITASQEGEDIYVKDDPPLLEIVPKEEPPKIE